MAEPWLEDADVTLYHGDVLQVLRELPSESVDCCVTSPPYWGLRDYGQEGQLGLESTPEEYVTRMVEVFREVRRVLAPHGTVWLNLGDSYAAARSYQVRDNKHTEVGNNMASDIPPGLKQKDLVGIPWRVAFALQADGWYLRSDIIWAKPNPMPESVTDRPTKAHEYVFLLSKQPRYFFDQEAVREPYHPDGRQKTWISGASQNGERAHENYANREGNDRWPGTGRNIRSVWEIATQPYPEAHFATFPEELARRCIAAGTSEKGKCPECGAPWVRDVERGESDYARLKREQGHEWTDMDAAGLERGVITRAGEGGQTRNASGTVPSLRPAATTTSGWSPSCECWVPLIQTSPSDGEGMQPLAPVPAVVLDPFIGSGTVAHVARKLGRHAVGIDLNESYLELAARRLQQQSLFTEAT